MILRNTDTRYGAVTRALHWATALLVLGLLCAGLLMRDLQPLGLRLRVYNLHKSFGVTVLALTLLRIGWHMYSRVPGFVPSLRIWERRAARMVHALLYVCLLGMPLSGWLMSSAAGRPVSPFGLFTLPDAVAPSPLLAERLRTLHETLAWGLVFLVCLHVAGALKHHVMDRDATLRRMLPFTKGG